MGEDPGRIRQDIEETRSRMGETVDAIGYKADVPSRMKESVSERKDALVSRVTGSMPDRGQVKSGAKRTAGIAKENPLGLAVGGMAVGFLLGLLVPSTRVEDERIGELADQVKDTAKQTGQEAVERGRQVAQEAAGTVKESARSQSEEMASSLKEQAQEVASSSGPSGGS